MAYTVRSYPLISLEHGTLFLLTCPEPKWRNPKLGQQWATKGAELHANSGVDWATTLGIAHYRLAEYPAAIAAFTQADRGSAPDAADARALDALLAPD